MDRGAIFNALGLGVKFDTKRFAEDAHRLNVVRAVSKPAKVAPDLTPIRTEKPAPVRMATEVVAPFGVEATAPLQSRKRAASESTHDAIDLMTGMNGTSDSVGSDVARSKKRKKKRKTTEDEVKKRALALEEVNAFRNTRRISVKGSDIPDPLRTFAAIRERLGLEDRLAANLDTLGFVEPTPIQMQAIPVMAACRSILACAPTGSGKTLAFGLPVLQTLLGPRTGKGFRAVVLSPTRELSHQTYHSFHRMAEGLKIKIFNVDSRAEKAAEKFAVKGSRFDVLITTPSRLVGLLNRKPKAGVDLSHVEWLVVDESDKLFEANAHDGGFRQQLATIYKACSNPKIRHAMFSATFQSNVEEWCRTQLDNVVEVVVGVKNASVDAIRQRIQFVGNEDGKLLAIKGLIRDGVKPPVLVFVESQDSARKLFNELKFDAVNVDVIHAGMTQPLREQSIKNFRLGTTWILICTELLGRGMDFQGVHLVVNYDFPRSPISYVHRIGRTGRAGRPGQALTFFTEDDTYYLRSIAGVMRASGCPVPDHLLTLTAARKEIGRMNKLKIARLKADPTKKKKKKKKTKS